jgi:uncharacterized protein YbjT (DUF2867 family)
MTRNPSGERAAHLVAQGITVVYGDLDKPASLSEAIGDARSVFSVQNFYENGVGYDGEIRQGIALADAAVSSGVAHFVQSTMADTSDSVGVAHFCSKFEVERYIRSSSLPFTMIGTVWFMDNVLNPKMGGTMTFPSLAGTLREETRLHMLAVNDLGAAISAVISNPSAHLGRKYDLASNIMTVQQMKATYRDVTFKNPKRWIMPNIIFRLFASDFAAQLRWHNRVNWSFESDHLDMLIPERTRFADYLVKHNVHGL